MKKTLITTLSAAVLVASAGMAMASDKGCDGEGRGGDHHKYGAHHDRGEKGERMLKHLDKKLNLSDAQEEKIKALFASRVDDREARKAERNESRKAMHEQMQSLDPASPDYLTQVQKMADARAAKISERMVEHAKVKAEIYAILTPEQQEDFRDMKMHKGGHGKGGHEKGERH